MNQVAATGMLLAFTLFAGCSDGAAGDSPSADLPPGWGGATRVSSLVQNECSGSPYEGKNEQVSFSPGARQVVIAYTDAHFRCEQEVEGFVKASGAVVDVLVQPIDMWPDAIAKCDCLYAIDIVLDPIAPGEHDITVYRRWDHANQHTDPVAIGSKTVQVD